MNAPDQAEDLVYFEFTFVGSAVRVAAIDGVTGRETIVMGPANASTADLQRLALAKLNANLARNGADR
jgi:hypothetical protein